MEKETVKCIYCKSPAYLIKDGEKYYLNCGKCGNREATEKLYKLLHRKGIKK